METKHATKIPVGQWRNQRGIQKIPRDKWKWKHNFPKSMGCNKSSSKEKVNSDTSLPQKTREISGKQANLPSKGIRKKQKQTKPKVSGKKETIKIREVIIK